MLKGGLIPTRTDGEEHFERRESHDYGVIGSRDGIVDVSIR